MIAGIFISKPYRAQFYIAERSYKGSRRLLWSTMPEVLNGALLKLVQARSEAALIAADTVLFNNRREIVEAVADMRIDANCVPRFIRRQAYRVLACHP
jgi:hypothetical protein